MVPAALRGSAAASFLSPALLALCRDTMAACWRAVLKQSFKATLKELRVAPVIFPLPLVEIQRSGQLFRELGIARMVLMKRGLWKHAVPSLAGLEEALCCWYAEVGAPWTPLGARRDAFAFRNLWIARRAREFLVLTEAARGRRDARRDSRELLNLERDLAETLDLELQLSGLDDQHGLKGLRGPD